MPSNATQSAKPPEERLTAELAKCACDPLGFVLFAFPWGDGELMGHDGPDEWQRDLLTAIRDGLITPTQAIHIAVASGHGPGKSALVAWLILWAMATKPDTKGVVTANTDVQLRTKTWAELAKWHRLCICRHWFMLTATALYSVDVEHERTWRVDMVPWSEHRTEAFAGLHNQGRRIIVVFDEASAIPDTIWETTEGALTDKETEIIWAVFGNPTRNTGRFRECFGRFRHRWITRQVDSRTARLTNKAQIDEWIKDYGEDSDFVRVRVRGVFPRAGSLQFISSELVEAAVAREPYSTLNDPLVVGVDVARFGDDKSIIAFRRGRECQSIPWLKYHGIDTVTLEAQIAEAIARYRPDAIFIDEGGVGGGIVDHLRARHFPVTGVMFGGKADGSLLGRDGAVVYANKRAEMWGNMRAWLAGGSIPNDPDLIADLTSVEYGYTIRDGRDALILERKEDMKRRGLASPDLADALALTFAYPVAPSDHSAQISGQPTHKWQYDPLSGARMREEIGGGVHTFEHDPFSRGSRR